MTSRPFALATSLLLAAGGCGGGGTGGGTPSTRKVFVLPHVLESSGRISRVAVGDVDGDGILDLLVLDASTASVSVLNSTGLRESPTLPSLGSTKRLARGAAAYESEPQAFVWDTTTDLCVADVNGDGRPDLVVAGGAAQQVGVWLGEVVSAGALRYHEWRWPLILDVTGPADRVAVGDVDGDGRADLVTLDEAKGQAHVLRQSSAAPLAFVVGNDPPAAGACRGLVLADMDRDGRMDILSNRPDVDAIVVMHGGGAAGWTLRESPTRHSTGRAMAVGDVDGDGWLDVVVLEEGGRGVVCLHQRSAAPRVFDDIESPLGLAVNEEGLPISQIAIDEPGMPRAGIAVDEEGTHSPPGIAIGDPGVNGNRSVCQDGLALADVDRDGVLDLLCSPTAGDADVDPLVVFGIRESPTRFSLTERLTAPGLRESPSRPSIGRLCAVCDLDGDGHVDTITGDPDFDLLSLSYLDDAQPSPAPAYHQRLRIVPTAQTTGRCRVADMDRDGLPDLVCATSTGLEIRWQDAAAPGTFTQPTVLAPAQSLVDVAIGDVNNDGCPDCIVGLPGGCVALLRDPLKPRSFLAPLPFPAPPPGGNFRALALGDLDGDGALDCVALRESPSKASLGRGHANGFFDVFTEVSVAVLDPQGVAVGDLDGDGRLDLAVCGTDGCAVVLQDHVKPLVFGPPEVLSLQRGVRVATGDVNGDGRCDLVTSGDRGVTVALQSAIEDGRFLPAYALSTQACGGLALGDVDRDGALDVCFVEVAMGTLVCSGGDPDFDLLRVISLNGLPPGVPYGALSIALSDLDSNGKAVLVVASPSALGAATGALSVFADGP